MAASTQPIPDACSASMSIASQTPKTSAPSDPIVTSDGSALRRRPSSGRRRSARSTLPARDDQRREEDERAATSAAAASRWSARSQSVSSIGRHDVTQKAATYNRRMDTLRAPSAAHHRDDRGGQLDARHRRGVRARRRQGGRGARGGRLLRLPLRRERRRARPAGLVRNPRGGHDARPQDAARRGDHRRRPPPSARRS